MTPKAEIITVGTIRTGTSTADDGTTVETLDWPGWRMRLGDAYLDSGPYGYIATPDLSLVRLGGYTIEELREIAR